MVHLNCLKLEQNTVCDSILLVDWNFQFTQVLDETIMIHHHPHKMSKL